MTTFPINQSPAFSQNPTTPASNNGAQRRTCGDQGLECLKWLAKKVVTLVQQNSFYKLAGCGICAYASPSLFLLGAASVIALQQAARSQLEVIEIDQPKQALEKLIGVDPISHSDDKVTGFQVGGRSIFIRQENHKGLRKMEIVGAIATTASNGRCISLIEGATNEEECKKNIYSFYQVPYQVGYHYGLEDELGFHAVVILTKLMDLLILLNADLWKNKNQLIEFLESVMSCLLIIFSSPAGNQAWNAISGNAATANPRPSFCSFLNGINSAVRDKQGSGRSAALCNYFSISNWDVKTLFALRAILKSFALYTFEKLKSKGDMTNQTFQNMLTILNQLAEGNDLSNIDKDTIPYFYEFNIFLRDCHFAKNILQVFDETAKDNRKNTPLVINFGFGHYPGTLKLLMDKWKSR